MTFRTRLLVTFLLAVLLPMIGLAFFVREEMTDRLTAQYERRVEALVAVIEVDLGQESETIAASLEALRKAVLDDNRFRRAAVDRVLEERRYLLDYAGEAMQLAGLSMLQIQDERGRIISSGHFRNEFDRVEKELPLLLASLGPTRESAPGTTPGSTQESIPGGTPAAAPGRAALVRARAPDGPFLALAGVDSFRMGNRRFTIVAGVTVGRRFLARLAREAGLSVELVYPGGTLTSAEAAGRSSQEVDGSPSATAASRNAEPSRAIVRELEVPFIDSDHGAVAAARFRVTHQLTELQALRSSIDRWFLIAVAATGVLAILLVSWLASRVSRPLVELADKTSRIDLDRLDIDFETRRTDEIGALSRLLGAMTDRLRSSAVRIRDAERRATLGELARQVNHDIKNGLTPIRNVFRHLVQLARSNPKQLPEVFEERQGTIDSGISYLENLASNYARLYPRSSRDVSGPCDANEIIRHVVADMRSPDQAFDLQTNLSDGAVVLGDRVSLRRVIENLVTNAIDSLESRPGNITISTMLVSGEGGRQNVRITVADTGIGMNEEQRARAFDDFYTTKDDGTGLGLSIVRRLVMDLDGSVRVDGEVGKGSRFVIDLPRVDAAQDRRQHTETDRP
jgi:signal transduction histidine kinase